MKQKAPAHPPWLWILRAEDCTGCGICADVCADNAIAMTRSQAQPEGVPGACVGCMACVRECPTAAIRVKVGEQTLN